MSHRVALPGAQGAVAGIGDEPHRKEAFRRLFSNVLAWNCDDHTKKLARLMDDVGGWSVAPAYDLAFARDPVSAWVSRHLMSVAGKRDHITMRDLMGFADAHAVPGGRTIIQRVADAGADCKLYAAQAGVSTSNVERVSYRLSAVEQMASGASGQRRHAQPAVDRRAPAGTRGLWPRLR